MRISIFLIILFLYGNISYSQTNLGIFNFNKNIGNPALQGSVSFKEKTQVYNLTGSGYNIWFERDEFNYIYNKIEGDFIIIANFRFEGKGSDPHRK